MHRTAVRAFRTHQTSIRALSRTTVHTTSSRVAGVRVGGLLSRTRGATSSITTAPAAARNPVSKRSDRNPFHTSTAARALSKHAAASVLPLTSSAMYPSVSLRRVSVALFSSLVGYGAWYAYHDGDGVAPAFLKNYRADAPDPVPTRTVLVIGAGELYTGTVVGEGPIDVKMRDKKVVEMLTPEQVDDKLQHLQESYNVNRGKGVVRYDLVQLPSNDPIEDDHAEQIVEMPMKGASDGETNDWMFWGVFDGHS
jgi:pyruvate dehydrogenase phosphatase